MTEKRKRLSESENGVVTINDEYRYIKIKYDMIRSGNSYLNLMLQTLQLGGGLCLTYTTQ